MEKELCKIGIKKAECGKLFYPAFKPSEPDGFPSIGARGCFLSHYKILKHALDREKKNVLVMEDDLAISTQIEKVSPELLKMLEIDTWGIAYLGHLEKIKNSEPYKLNLYREPLLQSHFYAVNAKILPRLVNFLKTVLKRPPGHPDGGPMHYDGALSTFRAQNPDIETYLVLPSLGWQRSSRSDIYTKKWFDKHVLLAWIVSVGRKIKNVIRRLDNRFK